jgi:hypothetical protein
MLQGVLVAWRSTAASPMHGALRRGLTQLAKNSSIALRGIRFERPILTQKFAAVNQVVDRAFLEPVSSANSLKLWSCSISSLRAKRDMLKILSL